jgi:hypothetical protein
LLTLISDRREYVFFCIIILLISELGSGVYRDNSTFVSNMLSFLPSFFRILHLVHLNLSTDSSILVLQHVLVLSFVPPV